MIKMNTTSLQQISYYDWSHSQKSYDLFITLKIRAAEPEEPEIENDGDTLNFSSDYVGYGYDNIAVDTLNDKVYVGNSETGTMSIIDGDTLKILSVITVNIGYIPDSIAIDPSDNIAYVANSDDTVSVINVTAGNYSKIIDIPVGGRPEGIAADPNEGLAYVATDEGIAVLYGTNKQVQVGVSFDLNPFHAGRIVCKDFTVPTNQYVYVDFRTQCTAQANEGFQFSSWAENTGSNSSRTISSSQDDWFGNFFNAFSGNPSPAALNVTKFGSFAANFKELPPAIFFARCVILWLQFSNLILQLDIILR